LTLRTEPHYVLGIDIGGTKLAVGIVSPEGRLVSEVRTPTLVREGPDRVIRQLLDLCDGALVQSGLLRSQVVAAGVGCGGPLDPITGVVMEPPNLPGWVDVPLVARLSDRLQIPVSLDNDANAAALGEHRFGAGRGIANMIYLTISTGVGGGVITDGRLYQGENGNAGEIGHMGVVLGGRTCGCGGQGCLEAYASGTSIAGRVREAIAGGRTSMMPELAGSLEQITAETVLAALRAGDALAREIWEETLDLLGMGVANVISIFNPRRVVLGGGITNFGDLLFPPLRERALRRVMAPLAAVVDIVPAELGSTVGILGAAAVALAAREASELVNVVYK